MSEEYYDPETGEVLGTTWRGIPLRLLRGGFYFDTLQTLYSLHKLTVNNVENTFSTAEDGAVVMDSTYLNWQFVCPVDAFTPEQFEEATVEDFFDEIVQYTASNTVHAWEEFAGFIGPNAATANNILSQVTSASITAPGMDVSIPVEQVPTLTAVASFSVLLAWIKSFVPDRMLSRPTSVMQTQNDSGRYNYGVFLTLTLGTGEDEQTQAMSFSFTI